MVESDRKILRQIFKDCGWDWTFKALAVMSGATPFHEAFKGYKTKRWPHRGSENLGLAAMRFMRDCFEDYTFNAVYDAAGAVAPKKRKIAMMRLARLLD